MRSLALIPVSLALVLAPRVAAASSVYPGSVQSDLSLSYTPPCTICHQTDSGGSGTATQPFAVAMKGQGLTGGSQTDLLQTALSGLEADKTDSDCDGVIDVQQLKDGRDPNTGEYIDGSGKPKPEVDAGCSGTGGGDVPRYGCGAQLAPAPLPDASLPLAASVVTVLGLALSRRRRRA